MNRRDTKYLALKEEALLALMVDGHKFLLGLSGCPAELDTAQECSHSEQ